MNPPKPVILPLYSSPQSTVSNDNTLKYASATIIKRNISQQQQQPQNVGIQPQSNRILGRQTSAYTRSNKLKITNDIHNSNSFNSNKGGGSSSSNSNRSTKS